MEFSKKSCGQDLVLPSARTLMKLCQGKTNGLLT